MLMKPANATFLTPQRLLPMALCTALLLYAAWTFINGLDARGLWVDEGWTMAVVRSANLSDITAMVQDDVHPPLYFYALYAWKLVAGESVFALRYLTALQGLLALSTVVAWGRSIAAHWWAGVLAGLLLVLHDLVGVLGQEIRQYVQLVWLAALVGWLYTRWWRAGRRLDLSAFVVAGLAVIYTHYWGVFVLLGVGIHWLLVVAFPYLVAVVQPQQTTRPPARFWPFVLAVIVIALGYLPWLPIMLTQINELPEGLGHSLPANREGLTIYFFQLFGTPEWFWAFLAVGALLVAWQRRVWVLLPLLVLGVGLGGSLAVDAVAPSLWYRSGMVVLPALFVLGGTTLALFRRPEATVLLLFIVVHSFNTTAAQAPPRIPWQDVTFFLAQRTATDEVVLLDSWFETYSANYYLDQQPVERRSSAIELLRRDEGEAALQAEITTITTDTNGVWLVQESPATARAEDLQERGWVPTARVRWNRDNPNYYLLLERFDRPPENPPLTTFAEMALRRVELGRGPEWLAVNVLWSATTQIEQSYTVSAFVLNAAGQLVAQHDSPPFENRNPTPGWLPNSLHYDPHIIDINGLAPGTYNVGLKVYYFTPDYSSIIDVPCTNTAPSCDFYTVATIEVE